MWAAVSLWLSVARVRDPRETMLQQILVIGNEVHDF
jgi:hypothetical protein